MTKRVIGAKTIEALEQIREVMDKDAERRPNVSLFDACIELVDSYEGDKADEELKTLLHDMQVGVETAMEPDQDPGWLVNAARAVIQYFEQSEITNAKANSPK